jgi:hypothetical protein
LDGRRCFLPAPGFPIFPFGFVLSSRRIGVNLSRPVKTQGRGCPGAGFLDALNVCFAVSPDSIPK